MTKDEMKKQAMHVLINSDAIWSAITHPLKRDERAAINIAIETLEDGIWTPVSEGPPEDGRYLCTYANEEGICVDFGRVTNGKWYIEPVAYMSLPEQYGGD